MFNIEMIPIVDKSSSTGFDWSGDEIEDKNLLYSKSFRKAEQQGNLKPLWCVLPLGVGGESDN